jgi:phospholipid/cholesterol/gamma-HCH transport system permease protein
MGYILGLFDFLGAVVVYTARTLGYLFTGRLSLRLVARQMEFLGVNTIPLAMLVCGFVGATMCYLLAEELGKRGAANYTGGFLLVALLREFIPVLSGVVMAGKAGSAITSEIGSMKITSQIEALRALSIDPHWFLTAPRMIALLVMLPVVGVFSGFAGFYAGFAMANAKIGISYISFSLYINSFVEANDFFACLMKCLVFGIVVAAVGCYMGYRVEGGAAGVGREVTNSVVVSIVMIFALDLILLPVLF